MILKYNEYSMSVESTDFFISSIQYPRMVESSSINQNDIRKILQDLVKDLKFNAKLISTFGFGIGVMYPIVNNLIENGSIKFDPTPQNIVLLCLTTLSITYLEESNNKTGDELIQCLSCKGKDCKECGGSGHVESVVSKKDARTLLEEMKLRGIGNGMVRGFVKCFKSISNFVKLMFKNSPYVVKNLIDMFSYTSLLAPVMNAISALVGKYDMTMDTLPSNLLSLGIGVAGIIAKNGLGYLIDMIKNKKNINKNSPKSIDLISDVPKGQELIKEKR